MAESRVTDYDAIADAFDARYGVYDYAGVRETLLDFLGGSITGFAHLQLDFGSR